jgi:hypothetical protein
MRFSSLVLPGISQIGLRAICILALVTGSVPITANEPFLSKPPEEWTEAEALQVLNDSPWAHTITTTTQDSQCDWEHPAFDGLFDEEFARRADSITPTPPAVEVKPDGAEYLVRLVSVKPMQAAVERLMSLDFNKWRVYTSGGYGLQPASKPTNLEERWYNPADEITIALVLKHPGPEGQSFLDYAFRDKKIFPRDGLNLWPCSAIRTANGQVTAVTAGLGGGTPPTPSALHLSFPSTFKGKPLISHQDEKLKVRVILSQRVFESTFTVNRADLFDGTETIMHIPSRVDEPTPAAQP